MSLKVLFLSNMYPNKKNPSWGIFVQENEKQLLEMGYDLDKVVVSKEDNSIVKAYSYIKYCWQVFDKIARNKYKFIYIHYLTYTTIPIFIYSLFSNLNFYINIHGDDLVGKKLTHKIMSLSNGFLLKRAKGIIVPSHYFQEILLNKYSFLSKSNIHINYSGGIDTEKFTSFTSPDKKKDFVFISRISEGKGIEFLLKTILNMKKNLLLPPDVRFHIYGTGNLDNKVKCYIQEEKLESYVFFHGELKPTDVPRVMSQSRFFIFPTERESLGLVLLESLSCGTPVICSKIRPLSDYAQNITNNSSFPIFYFDLNSGKDLQDKILNLHNYELNSYVHLVQAAKNLATNYSRSMSTKNLENFLKERD
ncbi:glycosyltransferase family 4 protein [Providencia rettgeri]|uniref:glycosyltransferase family 4 protein n=1 Tax=Providencia rettgeri TaxID=587 RepID=UPI0029D4ECDC|nr:glycosyltransferase family 4 protein [Providencia rettgeri]MDX7323552.1 glycosyltransferase family 4 protein [Providencia rettgeri]